jgi:subtilisin family serine protease
MRFLCALLIGLVALSSSSVAQSTFPNRGGSNWGKGTFTGPTGPRGPGIRPGGPSLGGSGIIIGPSIGRSCPKGTIGKWPACVAVDPKKCPKGTTGKWPNCREIAKNCPKGTIGKWPNCIDVAEPGVKSCPEGQIRKGKKCVQVTESDTGKATTSKKPPKEPPKAVAKKQDAIPPSIAALVAGRPHRPREVLVLVDGTRAGEIAARLAREHNVTADQQQQLPLLDGTLVRLRVPGNRSLESLLAALSTDPDVQLAQPNYDYRASKKPAAKADGPHYAGEKIRLDEAHRLARGQGVTIAVIDTAIDTDHPEIKGAVADMFDAVGDAAAPPDPHGTEIAGILAARAKLTGVAPDAKLLSVRAFRGGKKAPAESTTLEVLKGIDWAFASGAKVMNMSFAGPMDPLLERAIDAAADKGVIFIAAAGNAGPKAPPAYPAAYPDVIAVTAIDEDDKLYAKANRGDYISVAAPGVDIVVPALKGKYDVASGTSMAAAFVSGVVALLLERDAQLDAEEIRTILSSSARKPDKPLGKEAVGAGILDAAGALGTPGTEEAVVSPPAATEVSGER